MPIDREPAFPNAKLLSAYPGLTKREYIATHILAGLVVDCDTNPVLNAELAIQHADALLKALEAEPI